MGFGLINLIVFHSVFECNKEQFTHLSPLCHDSSIHSYYRMPVGLVVAGGTVGVFLFG